MNIHESPFKIRQSTNVPSKSSAEISPSWVWNRSITLPVLISTFKVSLDLMLSLYVCIRQTRKVKRCDWYQSTSTVDHSDSHIIPDKLQAPYHLWECMNDWVRFQDLTLWEVYLSFYLCSFKHYFLDTDTVFKKKIIRVFMYSIFTLSWQTSFASSLLYYFEKGL